MTLTYSSQPLRKGFLSINGLTITHSRLNGEGEMTIEREVMERGNGAAVLPYDANTDSVLLIRQVLAGAVAAGTEPRPWQVIAGMVDNADSYIDTVIRESEEEAGIILGDIVRGYAFMPSPGGSSERLETFIGQADLQNAGGFYGLIEEHEDIEARVFSASDAIAMLDNGEIEAGPAVVCLSYFARFHEDLRQQFMAANDTCPKCGGEAIRDDWDKVEGGSLNQYYSLTCCNTECGHTETNDIF